MAASVASENHVITRLWLAAQMLYYGYLSIITESSSLLGMGDAFVSVLVAADLRPIAHSSRLFLAPITEQRECRSDGQDSVPHACTDGRCFDNTGEANRRNTWASSLFVFRRRQHWPRGRCRLAIRRSRSRSLRLRPADPPVLHGGTSVAQLCPPEWLNS